ncbi:Sentrin-specific protease 5 [Oryzias melastigma]|uniref:Sentrin-specific protease 5 n=1 Tax=Oryzias melastigma TaxID=30732 RepID=A0A834KX22_ORYME|nr:Sentrin-specific protease 5 [Oryzias melastigma]
MVHRSSTSSMKTSASPQSTACTTAPPSVSLPGGTDQDLTQTTAKLLTADLTCSSDSSAAAVTATNQPIKNATKELSDNSTAVLRSKQILTPVRGAVNNRTSGRKRTPKTCDCCGPNSAGHNVKASGRGRGRDKDLGATTKRKVGQSVNIKVHEGEEEEKAEEKVQIPVAESDSPSQIHVATASTDITQNGPLKNSDAPEERSVQKTEDVVEACTGQDAVQGNGNGRDAHTKLLGTACRGTLVVMGREGGIVKALIASNMKDNVEIKSGNIINVTTGALAQSALEGSRNSQIFHGGQNKPSSVGSPLGNGETVSLTDTDEEMEDSVVSEAANGLVSSSARPGVTAGLGVSSSQESEMQVDQISDETDQVFLSLMSSNGKVTTPTECDQKSFPMEVETCHPAAILPPDTGPIAVNSKEHFWALRDHRLYCQSGTWEKNEMEQTLVQNKGDDKKLDAETQKEERLEQLIDAVQEFLEGFYIKYGSFTPLSESDVLEYLKKQADSDFGLSGLDIKRAMTRYRAALASSPVAGFMVTYNKHTLSLEDLSTLEEQNWLNDQIINMYGELIMEATEHKVHFFNSFFHKQLVAKGYDGVKRWTKKVDLFSKWLLLIPIHLEIHWSLVTVTMATKTISYYDSQGIVFRHTTDNIMKYLQNEAREKKQAAFQKGWKITIIRGIPQQKNDSDCGVFVLEYCRCLSVRQPLLFSQDDMPRIRKRIYKELCDCRLNR